MARTARRQDPAAPRARLSPSGTYIQLGLGVLILSGVVTAVVTFTRAVARADSLNETVTDMRSSVGSLTTAANDLTRQFITMQAGMNSVVEKLGSLQAAASQSDREAQARALAMSKLEGEIATSKDRLAAAESNIKNLEARIVSIEISSHSATNAASRGEGGK